MSILRTSDLRAQGIGSSQTRRMVRDEQLHRLRRGAFTDTVQTGAARHEQLIRATVPVLGPHAVISHISAGVLHGLPVSSKALNRVTFTSPGRGGGRVSSVVHQYRTPLAGDDVERVDGIHRTVLARTVIDLARTGNLGMAVAAADLALREGLPPAALERQLKASTRRPGLAQARFAVGFADPLSESPGESVSRVAMWRQGLPSPVLQFEVVVGGVRYRADFAWPQWRLLGEFDGKVKVRRPAGTRRVR